MFCVEFGEDKVPFVQLGAYKLRLDLEDLDDNYKKRAKYELRETPEVVENALRTFREYIVGEPDLYVPSDDDDFLMKFLRPFKFCPESAFRVLKKYYKFKLKHPKYALNVTPNNIRHVFDNEVLMVMPTRMSGARIMIINAGTKWNPKEVSIQDLVKSVLVLLEIAMMEPKTQVGGAYVILNMEGFSLSHVCELSPFFAKLVTDLLQECTPIRFKGIHVINQSIFFNMGYALFKPFLGEKLKRQLIFHGTNRATLCKNISPESLPDYLGGTASLPDYPGKLLADMFFYYEDVFEKLNSYGYLK